MDTFLISRQLYLSGGVTLFEVLDFIEHGSDHSPIYLRVRVFPRWQKRIKKPVRRILKASGLISIRKKLEGSSLSRTSVTSKVLNSFSDPALDWSTAVTREDMDNQWSLWVKSYDIMVEKLIGTRPVRDATWGRRFSQEVRNLCKEASMARSQFIEARRKGSNSGDYLVKWQRLRTLFIRAWEKSDKQYHIGSI